MCTICIFFFFFTFISTITTKWAYTVIITHLHSYIKPSG